MFKLQETEMMDPELDYTLMRVCKQMIKVMDSVLIWGGGRDRRAFLVS